MADTPTGSRATRNAAQTPSGRVNVEPPSSSRRPVHTPLNRPTPREPTTSGRRPATNAQTPHTAVALRAQVLRRANMLTPGKNRRQSGKDQRDSPFHALQLLGRRLAPTTNVIASSSPGDTAPSSASRAPGRDTDDDEQELPDIRRRELEEEEPELTRPRLSMAIDDDDDTMPIPQRSVLIDSEELPLPQDETEVEMPVRADNRRISAFSVRGDPFDETGEPSDFLNLGDGISLGPSVDTSYYQAEDTTVVSGMGDQSGVGFTMPPGYEDQTTFRMSEPDDGLAPTSPIEGARAPNAASRRTGDFGTTTGEPSFALGSDDGFDAGPAFDDGMDFDPMVTAPSRRESTKRLSLMRLPDEDDADAELLVDDDAGSRRTSRQIQTTLKMGRGRPKGSVTKYKKKIKKLSQNGTEYPPLPPAFVKRVAQTALQSSGLSNTRVPGDVVTALTQASDWFFEQVADDLAAYAEHAGRESIDERDVMALMRRQRQITSNATLFSLAQRHLPRELLQELRMPRDDE